MKQETKGHCGECCWMIGEDPYGGGSCAKIFAELVNCSDTCHGKDIFTSKTDMRHHLAVLIRHNRWRRSDHPTGFYKMQDPKELGKAIDIAVDFIKTYMEL